MPSLRALLVASLGAGALLLVASYVKAQSIQSTEGDPNGGAFASLLDVNSPPCVPLSKVKALADVQPLNEPAFRFVQALFIAIPPMSRGLPSGDKAVLAVDKHGTVAAFLVDGAEACGRFLSPKYLTKMILEVQMGKVHHVGERM